MVRSAGAELRGQAQLGLRPGKKTMKGRQAVARSRAGNQVRELVCCRSVSLTFPSL